MQDKQILIRPLAAEDSVSLLEWRNDPITRENSLTTEPVSKENHDKWFSSTLHRKDRVIFMADISSPHSQEISCGMCRFDISEDGRSAVVSINLNPQFRGQSLSLPILTGSIEAFAQQFQGVTKLEAEIRESNLPSISIFTRAGFTKIAVDSEVGHYSLSAN
jgi:UDP-2,4-diacetamido-2,4,6-trideoxy-beta-L-altropyranose hydrolase